MFDKTCKKRNTHLAFIFTHINICTYTDTYRHVLLHVSYGADALIQAATSSQILPLSLSHSLTRTDTHAQFPLTLSSANPHIVPEKLALTIRLRSSSYGGMP